MRTTRRRGGILSLVLAVAAMGCHDSTGPKNQPGVTPEGVVVEARVSARTFGRADTVWATAVLRNPTSAPVALLLGAGLYQQPFLTDTLPHWPPSPWGFVQGFWWPPGKPFELRNWSYFGSYTAVIGAHDSVTADFPFTVASDPPAAAAAGDYTFRAVIFVIDAATSRVTPVQSNAVTATLHD